MVDARLRTHAAPGIFANAPVQAMFAFFDCLGNACGLPTKSGITLCADATSERQK